MSWNPETTSGNEIVKVEGKPNLLDRPWEQTRWQRFKSWLFPHLKKSKGLAEEYAEAKVEKEKSEARKTTEEAAEIAARKDLVKQQEAEAFNALVNDIFIDDGLPQSAKMLKLAKLFENNPEILKQLTKVNDLIEKLAITKEFSIDIASVPKESKQDILSIPEKGEKSTSDSEKDKPITIE